METEDNLTRQIEEIEALTAIYPEELTVVNQSTRTYCITVKHTTRSIPLQFQFPTDYPSNSPPQFNLLASWLRGPQRHKLEYKLNEIYLSNQGESIIYLWIEAVQEFLDGFLKQDKKSEECDSQTPQLFVEKQPHVKEESRLPCPPIVHGEFVWDRKSKFQAHLSAVHHKDQVPVVLNKLKEDRKIAAATHNIFAYRIKQKDTSIMFSSCEDDGEIHAGSRLLHLLEILEAVNVIVIVTRWYGGIHLGPDRFKHINSCARNILHENGYIREKNEKKGPRTKAK